jgi:hypothetical protein
MGELFGDSTMISEKGKEQMVPKIGSRCFTDRLASALQELRPASKILSEGGVAQRLEQRLHKPRVGGSIPPAATAEKAIHYRSKCFKDLGNGESYRPCRQKHDDDSFTSACCQILSKRMVTAAAWSFFPCIFKLWDRPNNDQPFSG